MLFGMKGARGCQSQRGPGGGLAIQKEGLAQLMYNNCSDRRQGRSKPGGCWLARVCERGRQQQVGGVSVKLNGQ